MTHRAVLPALALLLPLAACGADAEAPDPGTKTSYAFSADNCGTVVEPAAVPERIVTVKSTSTELVVALGLAERLVGTAFADGPVIDVRDGSEVEVPVISEQAPSQEVVLEAEPDLVLAGWESNFAADTAGERDVLAKMGVATYVSPAACQEPDYQPNPMTFDALFDQFTEAGELLGATDAAADLVADQQAQLDEVRHDGDGLTALWWSSGEDTPFVGGTIGAPAMVLDAAGLTNVVDVEATWTSLGWEAIVDADPDVLVLVDAAWNTADDKIAALESNAATRELKAVKAGNYVVVPFAAAEAGVRSVSAVASVVEQVAELGVREQ